MGKLLPIIRFLVIPLTLLLFASIGCFVLTWKGATHFIVPKRRALEPRHHKILANPREFGLDLEHFTTTTRDGTNLAGIVATRSEYPGTARKTREIAKRLSLAGYLGSSGARGTIFLLHGRGGRKEDLLAVAERFVAADFRCIVYDARAHGKSGGRFSTYGERECDDLRQLITSVESKLFARGESLGPIGLFGNSLGAAVTIRFLPQAPDVKAAIASAPFANLSEIVLRSGKRIAGGKIPLWAIHGSMRIGGWRAGFDPYEISPETMAAKSTTPLFLIHGQEDGVIPVEHSERIFTASKSKDLIQSIVPDAYHSDVLAAGGDNQYQKMVEFYLRHLKADGLSANHP